MLETWLFRLVFLAFGAVFASKIARRARLIRRAPDDLSVAGIGPRLRRVLAEVVLQRKVVSGKPLVGLAHALVFWGFVAFGLYTSIEFLRGLGIADLTDHGWFRRYGSALVPFAIAVIVGISGLLARRVIVRPEALGRPLSIESVVIGGFILALMATFLIDLRIHPGTAATINWWIHALVILAFLVLIPDSKHLHLLISPVTIFLRSPRLGTAPRLDFEKEEVGLETIADVPAKLVIDAFTCVECGRCQMSCPAYGTEKLLNPKKLVLDHERAQLAGRLDGRLADVFDPGVLWQCTTCGACEDQCPVGVEHLPLVIGARRGLVSNGEAAAYLGAVYHNLERRGNIWGLGSEARDRFVESAGLETFDPSRHEYLVWLGCAGAFEADFQKSLRSLFRILRARDITFGILARERCTGDLAKRTGNEYLFQQLAGQNIESLGASGATRIVTSCPHCLSTLGGDYAEFGLGVEVVHSAILVARLTAGLARPGAEPVTYHDPCYLARYAGHVEEPRALLRRFGARLTEPPRTRSNPFCCGGGGGLLFEEHEEGRRISQHRLEQLRSTGSTTIVTACPFCAIMLKGAQDSSGGGASFVDLMSFVGDRLETAPGGVLARP